MPQDEGQKQHPAVAGPVTLIAIAIFFGVVLSGTRTRGSRVADSGRGRDAPAETADTHFRELVGRFIEAEFRLHPERATDAGDHRYDDRVEDLSPRGIAERLLTATNWKRSFEAIPPGKLSASNEADREWLIAQTDGDLLWNQEIRNYERDPSLYLPTAAVFSLIRRNFAPLEIRMRWITARELAALKNLEAARTNLKPNRTPPVAVDIVLAEMPGTLKFFRTELPAVFAAVPDSPDKAAFRKTNTKLLGGIESYARWLTGTLKLHATGPFAIGAPAYQRMLADDDMVDLPLSKLEEAGRNELARLLTEFEKTAHEIDSARSPAQVAAAINRDHPSAERLILTIEEGLKSLRAFVVEHHIVTIPSSVEPLVRETPPFMRATTFASMDTPGPLEKSTEAYYYVTLPDPSWPAARREQLLEFFSLPLISDTSVHEVYPGHYVQFLDNRQNPDVVRSLFYSGADVEGWALYCEQVMIDEGLHKGNSRYRLAELQMALLRACRYLVGLRMHTEGMSVDEAQAFFERNAYMTPNNARVEALRGTADPGYLRYQLGKLMILKLREDVRKKEGAAFNLGKFHDAFLREGAMPIRLIRRAMLGADGPLL